MRKPLIWDLVKDTERFQFLSDDQVEHVVINMAVIQQGQEGIWKVDERSCCQPFNFNLTGLLRIINGGRL